MVAAQGNRHASQAHRFAAPGTSQARAVELVRAACRPTVEQRSYARPVRSRDGARRPSTASPSASRLALPGILQFRSALFMNNCALEDMHGRRIIWTDLECEPRIDGAQLWASARIVEA